MATFIPSHTQTSSRETPAQTSLNTALRPWRRRIWTQRILFWGIRGLLIGLFLACLVLLISRLLPWASAPYWALGVGIALPVLGIALALWFRPTNTSTAHMVDERLSLHDRVGTAWELRDQTSVLAKLQRRDALKQLGANTPAKSIALRLQRATTITLVVLLLLLVPLVLAPNPMTAVLKQQAALQAQIAKQVANVEKIRQITAQQPAISKDEKQKIDQILRDLETKLQQAKNPNDAQQALSEAQAKLDQLRDPQSSNRTQARSAAGDTLKNSSNANTRATGQALSNSDNKSLAQSLQNLANQASKASPDQRKQLAQDLEKAANQANKDPNLSSALHQLAKSIADGSSSEISDAAKAVEAASSQTTANQAGENAINQASQSLQDAANNLASATDNTTGQAQQGQGQNQQGQNQGQNQQGQGQGQNQGQGQGQGQNQGQGQGQGQQGQGQGQQGQGQGQGQGQNQGGSGGNGTNGSGPHKDESVYIQGQNGQGSSTQSTDNNTSVVQPGSKVPYSQVIEQYNQKAHDAIDNSNVAPNEKDLVHDYFNTLEGQQ
ncbi:hypothetical protein [Dictyobacter formicarum]|uniref:Methyl-accepting transducer domain-containing protein n=1 Tax=Dictyobacter formicarum TaxID=2778368 RepID=A0ABQ3VFT7_9CHLR|nr:hypothetical protein [Dictyobacter formicarum]GHO84688.1 hypothetical protein KSZ_26940 [Dictyobacter formicarum]